MEPVVEIEPNPPSSKLLVAVVERAVMSTAADALPLDANDQSAASIGQLEALYHSASSPRLSATPRYQNAPTPQTPGSPQTPHDEQQ